MFRLKVEGSDPISLGKDNLSTLKFKTDIPQDSNARSTDVGTTLEITGRIRAVVDGAAADETMKLYQWSLVKAELASSYRSATIEVIAANQVVRSIAFPNAFVVEYSEHFDDKAGEGSFKIILKQKKDKLTSVLVSGGYSA